jgi:O-antigen/teichoic acid export membrane protein
LTRERILKLWYAPLLSIAMALMMVRLLLMARLLSLDEFASYSAGLLISSSFCTLGCLGLQSLLQRDLPMMLVRGRERAGGALLMQCLLVAILCAAVGLVVVEAAGLSLATLPSWFAALAILHGLSQQVFLLATVGSRSRGQALRFSNENLVRSVAVLAAASAAAFMGWEASMILSLEAAVSFLIAFRLLRHELQNVSLSCVAAVRLAWAQAPSIRWRSAFALLFVSLLSFVVANADRWLAAESLTAVRFAEYALAWTLLLAAQSIQVVINSMFYPNLARRYALQGPRAAFQIAAGASIALLVAGILFAAPTWLLINYLIANLYPAYRDSLQLIPIFLIIALLRISDFWSSFIMIASRESYLLVLNVTSTLAATAIWWRAVQPKVGELTIYNIAILALLLAATGYVSVVIGAFATAHGASRNTM